MAWSGLGAGTIGDPYQITTVAQFNVEMNDVTYINTHYFKLMNNLTFTGGYISGCSRSNVDGDNFTLIVDLNNSVQALSAHTILGSNIYYKNIKYEITDYNKDGFNVFILNGTITSFVLQNIEFNVLRTTGATAYFASFIADTIPSSWIVDNIRINGPFVRIFQNVACSVTKVGVKTTFSGFISSGFLCSNFNGALMEDCFVYASHATMGQSGMLCYYVNPTTTGVCVINKCFVSTSIEGDQPGGLVYSGVNGNITISNCFFNGEIVDSSNNLASFGINALARTPGSNWTFTNNYAHVKNLQKKIWSVRSSPNWFDDRGFSDWFVPSKDEMNVIKDYYNQIPGSVYGMTGTGGYRGFQTSSEVNETTFHRYSASFGWQSTASKNDYEVLILARFFNYNINDSPAVGKELANGTLVVWKDEDTLTAMMVTYVAERAAIFRFGKSGTLIGTSTAWGEGANNTALILATVPEIQSASRWMDWDYPSISNINTYIMIGTFVGTYNNNFYSVLVKDSKFNLQTYSGVTSVDSTAIRTIATFVGWDFTTIWEQLTGGVLPTLIANPEEKFVGLRSSVKTGVQNISAVVEMNTDLLDSATVGLIVIDGDTSDVLYDELGLSHVITLPSAIDYNLLYQPFTLEGVVHTPNNEREVVFYTYDQLVTKWITPSAALLLNIANVAVDMKLIHGSLFWNGYVFGSSRTDGKIVKVDILDPYNNPVDYASPTPPGGGATSIDQIVYCDGFIWGQSTGVLVRLNPNTMAWDSVNMPSDGTSGAFAVLGTSHDTYLYYVTLRYVRKLDTQYLTGATILTNCPGGDIANATLAIYDSYSQGQYIGWEGENPSWYLGDVKGIAHSIIADATNVYVAYTTQHISTYTAPDTSGWCEDLGTSVHELHVIQISSMTANGWKLIPKATDDMAQNLSRIFLGCEVQPAGLPQTLGFGCSIYSVRKSDLALTQLPKLHSSDNPPAIQSYASLVFGDYIIDCRTDSVFYIVDIADPDSWALTKPVGRYTRERLQFFGTPTFAGVPNEVLRADSRKFFMFGWNSPGGASNPSAYGALRLPSEWALSGVPEVQTVSLEQQ